MKRSQMNPISKKRRAKITDEKPVRDLYLKEHPNCAAKELGGCLGPKHVHEILTRARGGSTGDKENFATLCDYHNEQVSQDADTMKWAYANGLLKHSWDET